MTPRNFGKPINSSHAAATASDLTLVSTSYIPSHLRCLFPYANFNNVQSSCFDVAFRSNKTMIVASPTGSGKTGVLELALAKYWSDQLGLKALAIYVAPLKALVTERFNDWQTKTASLGIRVVALTGDDDDTNDEGMISDADLVVTTPEKWDSFTRFRRDAQGLIGRCGLLLIDEIHLLHEKDRGPTLESMVSRMLSISRHIKAQGHDLPIAKLRIIGVSATIENSCDIAEWLSACGTFACETRVFDRSFRPVPMQWIVETYPVSGVMFRFDAILCDKLSSVIQKYSGGRPSLVFCNSTKTAERAASVVAESLRRGLLPGDAARQQHLSRASKMMSNPHLASLIQIGCAFHNSTLLVEDRRNVERLFLQGYLRVLCCTSGLAQGLNLPARLVVIMNTAIYSPKAGGYEEYSRIEIMQAAGRAGRPQFDDVGVCVVMTRPEVAARYESILGGSETIESQMHHQDSLIQHLNAEIAAGYMPSLQSASTWLKSTFLFVRMKRNPALYKLPVGLSDAELEERLCAMCLRDLRILCNAAMIRLHNDGALEPLPLGTLMARHCIDFKTAKSFTSVSQTDGLIKVLDILSKTAEFERALYLRNSDKVLLFEINKSSKIRFPIMELKQGKKASIAKCKTTATKVNLLLQLKAGGYSLQDFHYADWILEQNGRRGLRALIDYLEHNCQFESLHSALMLQRALNASVGWHDDPSASVRQINGVGPTLIEKLKEGLGVESVGLTALTGLSSSRFEALAGKSHPWGQNTLQLIQSMLASIPQLSHTIEYLPSNQIRIVFTIALNAKGIEQVKARQTHQDWELIVGDASKKLILLRKFSDADLQRTRDMVFSVQIHPGSGPITAHLVHLFHHGLDSKVQIALPQTEDHMERQHPKTQHLANVVPEAYPTNSSLKKLCLRGEAEVRNSVEIGTRQNHMDVLRFAEETSEHESESPNEHKHHSLLPPKEINHLQGGQRVHHSIRESGNDAAKRFSSTFSSDMVCKAGGTLTCPKNVMANSSHSAKTSSGAFCFFDQFRSSSHGTESQRGKCSSICRSDIHRSNRGLEEILSQSTMQSVKHKAMAISPDHTQIIATPGRDRSSFIERMYHKFGSQGSGHLRRLPIPFIKDDLHPNSNELPMENKRQRIISNAGCFVTPSALPSGPVTVQSESERSFGVQQSTSKETLSSIPLGGFISSASATHHNASSVSQAATSVLHPIQQGGASPPCMKRPRSGSSGRVSSSFLFGIEHPLLDSTTDNLNTKTLKPRYMSTQSPDCVRRLATGLTSSKESPVDLGMSKTAVVSSETNVDNPMLQTRPQISISRNSFRARVGPDGELILSSAIDEWLSSAAATGAQSKKPPSFSSSSHSFTFLGQS